MDNVVAADYPEWFLPALEGQEPNVGDMLKAITAGTGTDSSTFTGGRALVPESLEQTLLDTLWGEKHIKLFKALKKSAVRATVDEFDIRTEYGSEWGVAVGETANPELVDPTIRRETALVKYYRDRREVSHVATVVRMIEDPMTVQEVSGTRRILGRVETDLFTGDADVFPNRITGLLPISIAEGGELVQDAHGLPVNTQDLFQELAGVVYDEGGTLTDVYHSSMCQADIDAALEVNQRIVMPVQAADGRIRVGASQRALATVHGDVNFEPDRFIRTGWRMSAPDVSAGPDAPGVPTLNSVTGNAGAIYNAVNLPAGDYYVRVSNINETGESAACVAQVVTLAATRRILLDVTSGDADTTGYRVYLSEVDALDASDCRFHADFAVDTGVGDELTVDGHWVTGTTTMHLISGEAADMAIDWRQLLPMTKLDLAITGPVIPFLLNLYGYLRVPKPNWHAAIINVLPSNVDGWAPLG